MSNSIFDHPDAPYLCETIRQKGATPIGFPILMLPVFAEAAIGSRGRLEMPGQWLEQLSIFASGEPNRCRSRGAGLRGHAGVREAVVQFPAKGHRGVYGLLWTYGPIVLDIDHAIMVSWWRCKSDAGEFQLHFNLF
jgi:hypothetical protein